MADNNILNSVSSWVIQIKKELDAQIKSEIAGIESKYGLTSSRTKDRGFNKLQNLNTYYQAMLDRGEYLDSDQITRAKADLKLALPSNRNGMSDLGGIYQKTYDLIEALTAKTEKQAQYATRLEAAVKSEQADQIAELKDYRTRIEKRLDVLDNQISSAFFSDNKVGGALDDRAYLREQAALSTLIGERFPTIVEKAVRRASNPTPKTSQTKAQASKVIAPKMYKGTTSKTRTSVRDRVKVNGQKGAYGDFLTVAENWLKEQGTKAWDLETTGLDLKSDKGVTFGFGDYGNQKSYFLDAGKKSDTIKNILSAINDKADESAKQLRKQLGFSTDTNKKISKSEVEAAWGEIKKQLITPVDAAKMMMEAIDNGGLVGWNSEGYDLRILENNFSQYLGNVSEAKRAAAEKVIAEFRIKSAKQRDAMLKNSETMVSRSDFGNVKKGDSLIQGVRGGNTLQRMARIISGSESSGAHEARSDVKDTLLAYAMQNVTNVQQVIRSVIEKGLKDLEASGNAVKDSNGEYTAVAREFITETLDSLSGIFVDNPDLEKELLSKGANTVSADAQIDALKAEMTKAQKEAFEGKELRSRFAKAGKDVSNITGVGKGLGTHERKLRDLIRTAAEKGYVTSLRINGDNYDIRLTPISDYVDENSIDWENAENQIQWNVSLAENGRIANKIDTAHVAQEWVGKIPTTMLETASAKQLDVALGMLKSDKFGNGDRTNDDYSRIFGSSGRRAINGSLPVIAGDEELREYLTTYQGEKTPTEIIKSMKVSFKEYLMRTLRNSKIQKVISDYYKKSNPYYQFNIDDIGAEVMNTMLDIFIRGGRYGKEAMLAGVKEDSLLKMLLESDEMKYYIKDAWNLIQSTGITNSAYSEGSYKNAQYGALSQTDLTAWNFVNDMTQRDVAQALNARSLTSRAADARQGLSGPAFRTKQGTAMGMDYESPMQKMFQVMQIPEQVFYQAARAYFEELGMTGEDLENSIQSLMDNIIPSLKVIQATESYQYRASRNTDVNDIDAGFLAAYGITPEMLEKEQTIDLSNYEVKEGDYLNFSKKFSFNVGDRLTGLVKTLDGWKLQTDSLSKTQQGTKLTLGYGGRMSMGGGNDPAKMFAYIQKWIANNWQNSPYSKEAIMSADAFVEERTSLKERNVLLDFAGRLSTIVNALKAEGVAQNDTEVLNLLSKENGIFSRIFEIDENGNLSQNVRYDMANTRYVNGTTGDVIFNTAEEAEKLLSGLDELGEVLLGQNWSNYKGLLSTTIGQQDVARYATKISGGGAYTPSIADDFKVINAERHTTKRFGSAAMVGMTDEEKEKAQKGLSDILAANERLNNTFTPAELKAQKDFQQLIDSRKSLDKGGYTSNGKDIEFVSKKDFSELKENQIYIEDIVTSFQDAVKNGKVSQDDYEKFAMEVARKKKDELGDAYKDANIVLTRARGNELGNVMLANLQGGHDNDYNYYVTPLERQQGRLLQAYAEFANATEENEKQRLEAFELAEKEYANTVLEYISNKDSEIKYKATHVSRAHSGWAIAQGGAFDENAATSEYSAEKARLANTVVMSEGRVRNMFRSESGSTKDQIADNLLALMNQFKLRTGKAFDYGFYDNDNNYHALFAKDIKAGKFTKEQLAEAEAQIVEDIITAIKKGNSNFKTKMGRYPYNQGGEGISSHIAIGDVGDDVIQVRQGLAKYLHGDFDGDYYRIVSNIFDEQYGKDAYNMEQVMQQLYDKQVWLMNKWASMEKLSEAPDAESRRADIAKIAKGWVTKDDNEFASLVGGSNFQTIGSFSQSATKMREAMEALNYTTGNMSTDADMEKEFNADVVKSFLQQLEQDAISSKKIYARLQKVRQDRHQDDSKEAVASDVVKLIEALRGGDVHSYINLSKEMGIWDETKADQPIQALRARWLSTDTQRDFLRRKIGADFADVNNAKANLTDQQIEASFGHVGQWFNAHGGVTLADATTWNKKMAEVAGRDFNGREYLRWKKFNISGTEMDENGNPVPSSGGGPNGSINSNGDIVINTSGNVLVNAQGNVAVNTNEIVAQMADAAKQGIEQGTASTLKTDNGKIIHEMRDESGRYVSPDVTWTGVTPPDQKTHAMTVKMNGKLYGKDDIFSVTEALNHEAPLKPWDQEKLHASSVMGTYAHRIAQELVNTGETTVDSFSDSVNNELKEIIGKSVSEGGLNMTSSDPKAQKQRQLAELAVAKAREAGIVNDNTITERTMAGLFGQQMFAGTMDALTYNKDTGFAVNDWKFSKSGGPEDIQKRGERMLQMQVYFTMYEKALEKLSNQVFEEGKEITAEDAKWFGLEGNDSAEWANDLTERLNHIRKGNVKFANTRAFEQNGQQIVEIVTSGLNVAMSMEEVAEILDKGIKGEAIPWDEIAKKYGVDSIKASLFSVNGSKLSSEVPPVVQEMINKRNAERTSGGSGYNTKSINDYLKQYKQILKIQEQIDADEKRLASSGMKGERADNIRSVVNMRKRLLGQLQAEVPNLDLEKGELNRQKLSEEELIKLKKEIALLDSNHGIQLEKNNALQKQSVGLVQQIANGFKASFRNLTDYSMAYAVIGKIRMAYSQLISYAEQLNASMVDLQIASGLSYSNIKNMMLDFNDLAAKVGKSTLEVSQAANDWLRAGYEGQDAATLVENSMQLSTLGMINSAEATEYLISMLKGWKLQVNEVSSVVDKLVAVDMSAAISAGDLATALARANTSAQLAGKICA